MARIIFTEEARKAKREEISREKKVNRIIALLPEQQIVADEFGITQPAESNRRKNVYPNLLDTAIKLMEMAGYEVVEK